MFADRDLRKSRPISLFGLARKEKRFLDSKEKRAPTRSTAVQHYGSASRSSEDDTAPMQEPCLVVLPVCESSLTLAPLPGLRYYVPAAPRGIQRGIRRSPLAVSIREVLRRGRKRNLPLLSGVSFATFLWPIKEKLKRSYPLANTKNSKKPGGDRPLPVPMCDYASSSSSSCKSSGSTAIRSSLVGFSSCATRLDWRTTMSSKQLRTSRPLPKLSLRFS